MKLIHSIIIIIFTLQFIACNKSFLDAKPSKSLVVPNKLEDLQGMIDNVGVFGTSPRGLQEITVDDLLATDDVYLEMTSIEQSFYIWGYDPFLSANDWRSGYNKIYYANTIIDVAQEVQPATQQEVTRRDEILGSAYFFRGSTLWDLLQGFAPVYEPATASSKNGIVLPLNGNVQDRLPRSDLEMSYARVIGDLKKAAAMLPVSVPYKTRPNRAAAYGMLARSYLSMGSYSEALTYADSALQIYSTLIDYNTLSKATPITNPFTGTHQELIYNCWLPSYAIFASSRGGFVDTTLFSSYADNDLRKVILYGPAGSYQTITGRYSGNYMPFGGIATDELYLIRAEAKARTGDVSGGMNDLNILLEKRWKTGTYIPFTASTETDALEIIIPERRKELVLRGLRWSDLKRLNTDPRFAVTISRKTLGETYILNPGDPAYQFLIPIEEIDGNPQVEQNPS